MSLKRGIEMECGVLFDLDGVLVSSDRCHYLAWKAVADELELPFDEERNHLLRGVSRRESLEIILDGRRVLDEAFQSDLLHRKNSAYRNYVMELGKEILLPGTVPMLDDLKAMGIKMAIASSSKNAPLLLEQAGLATGYFDAITDGNDISRSKPDPEVFLIAADRLSLPSNRCLVVEDAQAGVDAGVAAQMLVLGVGPVRLQRCQHQIASLSEITAPELIRLIK